jgi:hypothetical protein
MPCVEPPRELAYTVIVCGSIGTALEKLDSGADVTLLHALQEVEQVGSVARACGTQSTAP